MKSDTDAVRSAPTNKDNGSCQIALPMQNLSKDLGESASTSFSGTYGTAVATSQGYTNLFDPLDAGKTSSEQKGA